MVATGDILELAIEGYYGATGDRSQNVFQYEANADAPWSLAADGQDLADTWVADFAAVISPVSSSIVGYGTQRWRNLSDPDEIWVGQASANPSGDVTGDCLPPFAAWGFKLQRTTGATRNGAKRFWGVPESMQLNGIPTAPAALLLVDLAAWLGNGRTYALTEDVELLPVICRKDNTGALIASQPVANGQFMRITTQNTRKFGRGT